jgi:hypothetical protein
LEPKRSSNSPPGPYCLEGVVAERPSIFVYEREKSTNPVRHRDARFSFEGFLVPVPSVTTRGWSPKPMNAASPGIAVQHRHKPTALLQQSACVLGEGYPEDCACGVVVGDVGARQKPQAYARSGRSSAAVTGQPPARNSPFGKVAATRLWLQNS